MKHITDTIARLYPFEQPIICDGTRFEQNDVQSLTQQPVIESMFVFIANARNLLMFEAPLFDAEVMGGQSPEVNWLNEKAIPAPSDYAPVLFDVWQFDIGNASTLTNDAIDISAPVTEWRQLASSTPQLLEPMAMLDALHDIELQNSEMNKTHGGDNQFTAAVAALLETRRMIEVGSDYDNAATPGIGG